ncbi:MAG: hypothetical protein ACKOAH_20310, partial [Pirellula sp.]
MYHSLDFGCHDPQSGFANRVMQLAAQARERLLSVGAQLAWKPPSDSLSLKGHASGIVSFHVPGKDPQQVRRELMRAGVILSVRHGALRIALHAYNDANDI